MNGSPAESPPPPHYDVPMHAALLLALLPNLPHSDVRLLGETSKGETLELPLSSLPISDLAALDLVVLAVDGGVTLPPAEESELAVLALSGGEELRGRIAGGEGELLSLRLIGDVVLPLDVSSFRSLVFPARIPEDRTDPVGPPEELDRLYRRVGAALDPIDGTVESFSSDGIRFESTRVGSRLYPWREVAALFVEVLADGPATRSGKGAPVVVDLADGSRLRGRMQVLSTAGLNLVVGGDKEVSLPLTTLGEIARDDGQIAFLSDVPAAGEVGRGNPFDSGDAVFGMVWPFRPDRVVTGGALRAGGRIWRRGIGAHAPSRIRWNLDGGWRELRGAVAVDDSVLLEPAKGSVIFRLHLDGELAWESPTLSAGDPPVTFPTLALAGKRELALEADMAGGLNQGDRANWLRMMLVK